MRMPAAAALLCVLVVATGADAEIYPLRAGGDPRLRTAAYQADEVYRIHGFVGYTVDLQFEPGESFVGLAAGDIEALTYAAQGNHLFLKPRVAAAGTNVTVLTTRRQYHLQYSAIARPPAPSDPELIYAVRFTYPPPASLAQPAAELERKLQYAAAQRPRNLDYWYCGSAQLRPIAASDDGVQTRLRFAAHAELPAVFIHNDDGSESLLNFHMQGADMIIQRIAPRFIVRRGGLTGCIVNRGFSGFGERLESGTLSPEVVRKSAEVP